VDLFFEESFLRKVHEAMGYDLPQKFFQIWEFFEKKGFWVVLGGDSLEKEEVGELDVFRRCHF
jgi:peptide subunit release factor 1 (eRF1)